MSRLRARPPATKAVRVLFVLCVLVIAVVVSYGRGGRLRHIADATLRWSWLLFAGVGLQVVTDLAAGRGLLPDARPPTYLLILISQLLVVVWVVANRRIPGMLLVAIGLALNALVMAANGAMPVSPDAMAVLGVDQVPPGKHTLLTDATRLPWLADILPLPPLRTIISVGDVVIALGIIPAVHGFMTAAPAAERRGDTDEASADER